jgi:hypothetical protein
MVSRILRCWVLLGLLCPVLSLAVTPMITAGANHSLALKSDGTNTKHTSPVVVNDPTGVDAVLLGSLKVRFSRFNQTTVLF